MKRLITPNTASAIAWWNANPNAIAADCYVIELSNGQTINATNGQWDLTLSSALCPNGAQTTFKATANGRWSRGKITSEAGSKLQAGVMTLTCVPKLGAQFPGLSVGVLNAAVNHLFDAAVVWVYTAWMPAGGYGNVQVVEVKFQGRITKCTNKARPAITFDCADPFFLMNMKVPSRLIQSNCYKSFADSNCGLSASYYTVAFTAASGSTNRQIAPASAFTQPDGYFTQGVITCVTGANAGLSQTVKVHVSGALQLVVPFLLPVSAGDTFSVIKGCDQTPTTCAGMTRANGTAETEDWRVRFGGMPFCPPPATAI